MAGDRSDRTAPAATADQPPVEGETVDRPRREPGRDVPGSTHEEPLDGPEPDPELDPSEGPPAT